jgi:hypothetical protein
MLECDGQRLDAFLAARMAGESRARSNEQSPAATSSSTTGWQNRAIAKPVTRSRSTFPEARPMEALPEISRLKLSSKMIRSR